MTAKLMFIHCLSPLHAGVGQGVDVVDLAIARDRATGFPYLPGSSIKGALRDRSRGIDDQKKTIFLFGPESANASDHAGCIAFGDGNLLCLPTRSIKGTFAYVTSPYLLQRLNRDLQEAGLPPFNEIPSPATDKVAAPSDLMSSDNRVYFEDLDLFADSDLFDAMDRIAITLSKLIFSDAAQQNSFLTRFCIVHDDVMAFLSKHGTDVVTRVSLDANSKTAKDGQLWTEENLPSESILVALTAHIPGGSKNNMSVSQAYGHMEHLSETEVQFGGKATVGRGRCRITLQGGNQ